MSEADDRWTITVPEAGKKYLGLSRNAAYAAAGRGEIPTVRIGRLLRVPIKAVERMLDQVGRDPA
jgi:excisionase family DNA binding protein